MTIGSRAALSYQEAIQDEKNRLKKKIEIDPITKCWNWVGSTDKYGRGRMALFRLTGNKTPLLAYRIAYLLYKGPIYFDQINHICDNPRCCNPNHLKQGTQKDNIQDMLLKRRRDDRGEGNPSAKITKDIVKYIRKNYIPGWDFNNRGNGALLAKKFGISRGYLTQIVNRKAWKHI